MVYCIYIVIILSLSLSLFIFIFTYIYIYEDSGFFQCRTIGPNKTIRFRELRTPQMSMVTLRGCLHSQKQYKTVPFLPWQSSYKVDYRRKGAATTLLMEMYIWESAVFVIFFSRRDHFGETLGVRWACTNRHSLSKMSTVHMNLC